MSKFQYFNEHIEAARGIGQLPPMKPVPPGSYVLTREELLDLIRSGYERALRSGVSKIRSLSIKRKGSLSFLRASHKE